MKKWYKGEIKVLYDADENKFDIETQMFGLRKFILQEDMWSELTDIEINDMKETDDKVEE